MIESRAHTIAIFALFITVLAALSVSAYDLKQIDLIDELNEDLSVHETINITLLGNTDTSFSFNLPKGSSNISVNSIPRGERNTTLDIPLDCSDCTIMIRYTLPGVVKSEGNQEFSFSRTLNLPRSPDMLQYTVYLPPSYMVLQSNDEIVIVPSDFELHTDGSRIHIVWQERSPSLPKIYSVRYQRDKDEGSIGIELKEELSERHVWMLLVIVFILGAILGISVFAALERTILKPKPLMEVPSSLLTPDEKAAIGILSKSGMKMRQKEMVKQLGWSKSKVSAVVSNLEYKKIVVREKIGRNYDVELIGKLQEPR